MGTATATRLRTIPVTHGLKRITAEASYTSSGRMVRVGQCAGAECGRPPTLPFRTWKWGSVLNLTIRHHNE